MSIGSQRPHSVIIIPTHGNPLSQFRKGADLCCPRNACWAPTVQYLWIGIITALAAPSRLNGQTAPPLAERQDVTETFFGQSVIDPYRWLESWHEAKAAQWLKAQDNYTLAILTSLPGREKFLARVKALDTASTRVQDVRVCGGKIFYLKAAPGANNVKLYVRDRSGAQERLLLDPELLTKDRCALFDRLLSALARRHASGLRNLSRWFRGQCNPHP